MMQHEIILDVMGENNVQGPIIYEPVEGGPWQGMSFLADRLKALLNSYTFNTDPAPHSE